LPDFDGENCLEYRDFSVITTVVTGPDRNAWWWSAKTVRRTSLHFDPALRILIIPLDATNQGWEPGSMAVLTKASPTSPTVIEPLDSIAAADTDHSFESGESVRMFDGCRQYLMVIASQIIGPDIQSRLGASDLVQDTFVEAQRHLAGFRGGTEVELRAWLRKILECRLVTLRRSCLGTGKHAPGPDVAIETVLAGPDRMEDLLVCPSLSPSNHVARSELAQALDQSLARLPEHYRQAIVGRHQEQLSWEEIGRRLECTAEAARKVWSRAVQQLRRELADHGAMS
jgi:RNA polymerase sigma-70 factor (ECF subfamily)